MTLPLTKSLNSFNIVSPDFLEIFERGIETNINLLNFVYYKSLRLFCFSSAILGLSGPGVWISHMPLMLYHQPFQKTNFGAAIVKGKNAVVVDYFAQFWGQYHLSG